MNPWLGPKENYIQILCPGRMVFLVNKNTLEPVTLTYYDAYCLSRPRYQQLNLNEWNKRYIVNELW
jgi:hypothetical protein